VSANPTTSAFGKAAGAAPEPSAEQTVPAQALSAAPPRRLGFNLSVLAGGQAITWSVTLLWTLVVPRVLGPAGMGQVTAAYAIAAILIVVVGLGTKTYLVREIVAQPEEAGPLMGAALALRLCAAPLVALFVFAYGQLAHFGPETLVVLYIATGAAVCTLLAEPFQAGWQGMERMEYLAYSDVLDKTAQSFLGIAVVLAGLGVVGLVSSALVIEGLVVLLNVWWMRRYIRIPHRLDLRRMGTVVRRSLPYWSFGVFFMIYLWIDTAMLSLLARPAVVGWYGVSTKLFTTLMFVPAILATAWLPRLVTAFDGGPTRLHAAARTPLELTLALALPICVVTAMTAGPVILVLYGPEYAHAAPVLTILALCLPPMYFNTMLNQVLVAAQRQRVWTWVMLGATIVNPVCNLVFIRVAQARWHNGAIGAAVSLLVTELLIVAVGIAVIGRHVLGTRSLWRLARVTLAALAMAGVMYVLRPFGFVAAAVAGGVVFMGAVVAQRVPSAEEWAWARHGTRRVSRRLARWNPVRRGSP
jgi:O-antigen/teichoic acid export membrane protein